jgi:hypothetical protein
MIGRRRCGSVRSVGLPGGRSLECPAAVEVGFLAKRPPAGFPCRGVARKRTATIPHKRSHTAAVLDSEQLVGELRVTADRRQRQRLLEFAEPFTPRRWAIEAASGLGSLLAQQLVAAGETVLDVPPALSARVRLLDSGRNDKNDAQRRTDQHDTQRTEDRASRVQLPHETLVSQPSELHPRTPLLPWPNSTSPFKAWCARTDTQVMAAVDNDETARLTALVERLLRDDHARPDRCCQSGCLHCPQGRRMVWHRCPAP